MPLNTEAHVQIGTSIIGMTYDHHANNIDCMSTYKLREWKAAFGIRPIVCCEAWVMISSKAIRNKLTITHFYWALYWMRTYQIESEAARVLKTNPKTLREKVRQIVRLLSGAMNNVINWNRRTIGAEKGEKFTITVDGTHFLIEEVYNDDGTINTGYWSFKYNHPGLAYEIAVSIFSDQIVWVNGPFRAGMSDLKIFKEKGLSTLLIHSNERAIADGTYTHFAVSQRGNGSSDWKHAKNRYRARQETVNRRLKIFRCLQDRWRHDHRFHGDVVRAIALLTQLSFGQNPLMEAIE